MRPSTTSSEQPDPTDHRDADGQSGSPEHAEDLDRVDAV